MRNLCITVVLVILGFIPKVGNAQDVFIAKYHNNKRAALSFTFDDGLREQYTVLFPKLKKLGIKATFCLIGSRMEQQPKNPDKQTFSWQQAKEMAADGQEITSHGWEHRNVTKLSVDELRHEVQHNDSVILQHTGILPRTYFYPGNRKSDAAVAFCSKGRVGTRTRQVSLGSKRTQEWFEKWIDSIIKNEEWGVTMTHGIRTGYDCFGDETRLWRMFDYALSKSETLWIATFHDIAAYIKERDNTTLHINVHKNEIIVKPHPKLNKSIFNFPLTMIVDFKPTSAKQDKKLLPITMNNNKWCIEFNPNGGDIFINK